MSGEVAEKGDADWGKCVITVIFEASPLITACKFKVKKKLVIDHLLSAC